MAAYASALDPVDLGEPWAGNAQLIKERNYSGAIERLRNYAESTSKLDDIAAYYYTIGDIHYKYTHDYDKALEAYQEVVDLGAKAKSPAEVEPYMALSRMLIAAIYMRTGRYDDAVDSYEKVAADYPETRFAAGAMKDIDSVQYALPEIKSLREIIAKYPDTELAGEAQFEIAELQYLALKNLNNPQQAIQEYSKLVEQYPDSHRTAEAQLKIGNVYWALHKPEKAIEAYQKLVKGRLSADKLAAEALLRIGRIYYNELYDYQKALHTFSTFISNYPTYWKFPTGVYWQGMCYEQIGNYGDAGHAFEMFVQLYPDERPGWLADIDQFGSRNVKERIESRIAELMKIAPEAKWKKAERLRSQGKYRQALTAYRELMGEYPESEYSGKARTQLENVKYLAEIQICRESINRGDKAADSQYRIAEIYETRLHNYASAVDEYEKVVKNYPESYRAADALYRIGVIYSGMGSTDLSLAKGKGRLRPDYDMAIEKCEQLISMYPNTVDAARAYYQMGEIYRTHLEDYRQALEAYAQVVNNYPRRNFYEGKGYKNSLADEAQFKIGRIYYENLHDYEMSSEVFSKFLDDFPDSCRKAAAYSYIAAIHERSENQEAAADYLEQIIDLIVESDVQSAFFIRDALHDGDKKRDGMLDGSDAQMDIIRQLRSKVSQLRTRVARSGKEDNRVSQ